MAKDTKRKELTPEELAEQEREGKALQKIYMERKRQGWLLDGEKISQGRLGAKAGGISQGAISHFFEGRTRLPRDTAILIADALGVTVADFSSRLAQEILDLAAATMNATGSNHGGAVLHFVPEVRNYRKQVFEKLIAMNVEQVEKWLEYADYLISRGPPIKEAGSSENN